LVSASANIPGKSIPAAFPFFRVFAVAAVAVFRLVMIVVLGIAVIVSPLM
jgi:hypothetical protein